MQYTVTEYSQLRQLVCHLINQNSINEQPISLTRKYKLINKYLILENTKIQQSAKWEMCVRL